MFMGASGVRVPDPPHITIDLAPVYNILNSLGALAITESNLGLGQWVLATVAHLSPAEHDLNHLLFEGFGTEPFTVLVPEADDFDTYLHAIATLDPVTLRDRVLRSWLESAHLRLHIDAPPPPSGLTAADLLHDAERFRAFAAQYADKDPGDLTLRVHALLNDPPRLQALIVAHFTQLWQTYMAAEWARIAPGLTQVVNALREIDLTGKTTFAAIEAVTGRDLRGILDARELARMTHIQLIPSRHNGPYVSWFGDRETAHIVFNARLPSNLRPEATALDQTELIERCKALADDTRIEILRLLKARTEASTQDIIDHLGLDKSAASRHLRQLTANRLVIEWREADGKSKRYRLNPAAFDEIGATLTRLF